MDIEEMDNEGSPISPKKENNQHRHQSIKSKMSLQSFISVPQQKNYPQRVSLQSDISGQQRRKMNERPLIDQICYEGQNIVYSMLPTRTSGSDVACRLNRMSEEFNQQENQCSPIMESEKQSTIQQQPMIFVEEITCKCLKSKCLLMYCECFSKGQVCNQKCGCSQCRNNSQFQEKRQKARQSVLEKDPNAFTNKLELVGGQQIELAHKKGCNCKKTHCFKKYCECFHAGVKCTYLCNCEGCYNGGENINKQIN